jgi:imidazolonepropionase-like amidohydrolase
VPYGYGIHTELALLAAAGIPNDQVLRLATAGSALALGLGQALGTIEAGKLADFVVVTGDPLARIADSASIIAIVRAGVWLTREELLERHATSSP